MAAAAVVLMRPPVPGMCAFCDVHGPLVPAEGRYVDAFGHAYELCARHHAALVGGLRRIAARRLARSRYTPGVGASAVHPAVQEQVIAVLAEALAERMLAAEEEATPAEKSRT